MKKYRVLFLASLCVLVASVNSFGLPLALSDVTLNGDNASAYYGPVTGTGEGGNVKVDDINNNYLTEDWTWSSGNTSIGTDLFSLVAYGDNEGGSSSYELGGFTFTLSAVDYDKTGDFTLEVTPESGLPAIFDFIFALKAGTSSALYFFDDYTIEYSMNEGKYIIAFLNKGGQIPALSNIRVFARVSDPAVPEPATMLLFGTGLAGLAGFARRRRS